MKAGCGDQPASAHFLPGKGRWPLLFLPASVLVILYHHARAFADPFWVPVHDTLTQYTEFLYALAAFQNGEMPLWNSYWTGGQPFYLLLNHGLLLNPLYWIWMAIGTAAGLSANQIYICVQLSALVIFALGGFFLARLLGRSVLAGATAFIILIFSGHAGFWVTQVYALHIIMYVPWVLVLGLRYAQRPCLLRAFTVATVLGISMNTYYPAYLFTFAIILGILCFVLYRRRLVRLPFRTMVRHALAAVPYLALLLLPTYLSYQEISADYYQVARSAGPGRQHEPPTRLSFDGAGMVREAGLLALDIVTVHNNSHLDSPPLVGPVAIALVLFEILSCSRRARFWSLALLFMTLHYLGRATPYHDLSRLMMPLYGIIGSTPFFSGFVVLCTAMLAALGMERFARRLRQRSPAEYEASPVVRSLALLLLPACISLAAAALAADMLTTWSMPLKCSSLVMLFTVAGLAIFRVRSSRAAIGTAVGSVLLLNVVIGGLSVREVFSSSMHTTSIDMFSNGSDFRFSLVRPDRYFSAQPMGPELGGECCVNFYHLAERFDGPYHFDSWESLHTLIIPRAYYDAADFVPAGDHWSARRPGFAELMRVQFHWFPRYAIAGHREQMDELLPKRILPLSEDHTVRARELRTDAGSLTAPADTGYDPAPPKPLRKTANTITFSVDIDKPMFLLYTDLYHPGFRALVDGKEHPLLPGMGIFKALELDPGLHTVSILFKPQYRYALILYLLISIPALIALVGISARALTRRTQI